MENKNWEQEFDEKFDNDSWHMVAGLGTLIKQFMHNTLEEKAKRVEGVKIPEREGDTVRSDETRRINNAALTEAAAIIRGEI